MKKPDYNGAKDRVLWLLKNKLPKGHYYHNALHATDVENVVESLARNEIKSEEDILLLKTAALYHDVGFIKKYSNNEPIAVQIAKEILPNYNYSREQIYKISETIMATQMYEDQKTGIMFQNPKTDLGEIICDADLDNFGSEKFLIRSELLRLELNYQAKLKDQGKCITWREWFEETLKLLENHEYFTASQKLWGNEGKQKNIEGLRDLLKYDSKPQQI